MAHVSIAQTTDLCGYRAVKVDGRIVGRVSRRRKARYGGHHWYGFIQYGDPTEFHFESVLDLKVFLVGKNALAKPEEA